MLGIFPAWTAVLRASVQAWGIALETGVPEGYEAAQVGDPTWGKLLEGVA
jgi:hypothetical protein